MTTLPSVRRATRSRCLGDVVGEYVAGRLSPQTRLEWDRHLVTCDCCRRAVDSERRLLAALRDVPRVPGDLRVSLLAMGALANQPTVPPVPKPAGGTSLGHGALTPLPVLSPSAPACHRSVLRAAVFATLAASASAAAAWSIGVASAPQSASGSVAPTGGSGAILVRSRAGTTATGAVSPRVSTVRAAFLTSGWQSASVATSRPWSAVATVAPAQSTP